MAAAQPNCKEPSIDESSENPNRHENGPPPEGNQPPRNTTPSTYGYWTTPSRAFPFRIPNSHVPVGSFHSGMPAGLPPFAHNPSFGFGNPLMPSPIRLPNPQEGQTRPASPLVGSPASSVSSSGDSGVVLESNCQEPSATETPLMIPETLVMDVAQGDRIWRYFYRQSPVSGCNPDEGLTPQVITKKEAGVCSVDLATDAADFLRLLTAGERQQLAAAASAANLGVRVLARRGPTWPRRQRRPQGQNETADAQAQCMRSLAYLGAFAYFAPCIIAIIYVLFYLILDY